MNYRTIHAAALRVCLVIGILGNVVWLCTRPMGLLKLSASDILIMFPLLSFAFGFGVYLAIGQWIAKLIAFAQPPETQIVERPPPSLSFPEGAQGVRAVMRQERIIMEDGRVLERVEGWQIKN